MILCDSGPLIAASIRDDDDHRLCVDLFLALHLNGERLLVPPTVIAEVGYMLERLGSPAHEAAFLRSVAGSDFELKADLVLLAMGFVHPVFAGMLEQLDLKRDPRGNVAADTLHYRTSNPKIFAAGDMRRGQSLVVWAIREGRQAARAVDEYLMGASDLPR